MPIGKPTDQSDKSNSEIIQEKTIAKYPNLESFFNEIKSLVISSRGKLYKIDPININSAKTFANELLTAKEKWGSNDDKLKAKVNEIKQKTIGFYNEDINALNLDNDTPYIIGDLDKNGYKILHSNHKSGQDAFAISKDKKTFVVCDGMGSYGKSGIVAKQLSAIIAKGNFSFKTSTPETFTNYLIDILKKISQSEDFKRSTNGNSGETTLSIIQKQKDGSYLAIVAGDSPIYIIDEDGSYKSIGDDSVGSTNTNIALGIQKGKIDINLTKAKRRLIRPKKGRKIVLSTDWFSDNIFPQSKEYAERKIIELTKNLADAKRNNYHWTKGTSGDKPEKLKFTDTYERSMKDMIEYAKNQISTRENFNPLFFEKYTDPQSFYNTVKHSPKKHDDATIIIIDPEKL